MLNEAQIVSKWAPMIEGTLGVKDKAKVNWIAKYANFHALNESAMGGVSSPYATLNNVPGVGNPVPASQAAMSAGSQMSPAVKGSGDKWPALLPMALQVAARTVGFDIVNVVPMQGPTGVLSYLDYVYAGGKQPFGAQPAYSPATANPKGNNKGGKPYYSQYEAPLAFKLQLTLDASDGVLAEGTEYTFTKSSNTLKATYVGKSRIDGFAIFHTGAFSEDGLNLSDIFDGATTSVTVDRAVTVSAFPQLVSTLEDHIQGFAGAGALDTDKWSGNFVNAKQIYDPMERGIGEISYPRALGLQVFTKFISVGTNQVSINVTQEQIQDLNSQWGIDVIAMVENAGVNEISQSINKQILSRAFALGWLNHVKANEVEGINLNLNTSDAASATYSAAVPDGEAGQKIESMVIPEMAVYGVNNFENQDTIIKRVVANVMAAGNVIMQRGRRGPANFIVTNVKLATALQSNSQYSFSPVVNTLNQENGSLYPMGTIAGMTLYVDPNMAYDDTRILVGRKGAQDEPGLVFSPYLLAEKVQLISEGTGSPKVIIKSRYALTDVGFHPETQYLTLYVKTNAGALI